ncbi:meiotic nuclear division protein 1 [Tanacetum coccineum]
MERCLYTYNNWMGLGLMDLSMGLGQTNYSVFDELLERVLEREEKEAKRRKSLKFIVPFDLIKALSGCRKLLGEHNRRTLCLYLKSKVWFTFWSLPSCAGNQLRNVSKRLESELQSSNKRHIELDAQEEALIVLKAIEQKYHSLQATPKVNLSDEEIAALTKQTQDGGTKVMEAKAEKGPATLSMA